MFKSRVTLILFIFFIGFLNAKNRQFPSNQPFASFYFPNDLLDWTPQGDADAIFNKSHVGLKDRFVNPNTKVNPHAKDDQAKIAALDIFGTTSNNPSQGSLDLDYFCFNYWQYIDKLVFWGGSAGEGIILAPNSGVIDAAHKNGVPVLGTIFFPPTAYGGNIAWVNDLVQKSGETFPVADKLIEMAEYYGFEGYFINQETAGGNSQLADKIKEFMVYIQDNSDLEIMWYDAMTEAGGISWQEMLNSYNDSFLQDGSTLVSNSMFLDFGWSGYKLTTSRINAINLGRSEYELFAGVDVQANSYNTYVNWNAIFPEGENHVTSLGFYVPSSTFHEANNLNDFYQRAKHFWVGPNGNPSNTTNSNWPGLAHYVSAKSAINDLPFFTNFCTGQGQKFFVNGVQLAFDNWNNIGLQDVLPSWRWIVESSGSKLTPSFDWTDAYNGGNCLKISGNLTADNTIKLFKTKLQASAQTKLKITYKSGNIGATDMKIGVAFEDNPNVFTYLNIGDATSADWNLKTFDLSSFSGKTVAVISLFFTANGKSDYEMKVGQIGFYNNNLTAPTPPSNLTIVDKVEEEMNKASLRLKWDHSTDEIDHYNVFYKNPDNSLTYLGGTSNNAYFVIEALRTSNETTGTIVVKAVGKTFESSTEISTTFEWGSANPPTKATNPNPSNNSTNVDLSPLLEWQVGERTISHDIYFGTTNPPPFIGNQTEGFYSPTALSDSTIYYWKIDERNDLGVASGDIWKFYTRANSTESLDKTNDAGAVITARGQNSGEEKEKAFDNNTNTKWLDFSQNTWICHQFNDFSSYIISKYTLTSANDAEERDPKNWTLKGSNDGNNWDILDNRCDIDFPQRLYTKTFYIPNTNAYSYYKFDFENNFGNIFQISEIELWENIGGTSIKDNNLPQKFNLEQNYPNPFNPTTQINYQVAKEVRVEINVYNTKGEFVTNIVNSIHKPGRYKACWNASNLNSGVYFIKENAGNFESIKKAVLIK